MSSWTINIQELLTSEVRRNWWDEPKVRENRPEGINLILHCSTSFMDTIQKWFEGQMGSSMVVSTTPLPDGPLHITKFVIPYLATIQIIQDRNSGYELELNKVDS